MIKIVHIFYFSFELHENKLNDVNLNLKFNLKIIN